MQYSHCCRVCGAGALPLALPRGLALGDARRRALQDVWDPLRSRVRVIARRHAAARKRRHFTHAARMPGTQRERRERERRPRAALQIISLGSEFAIYFFSLFKTLVRGFLFSVSNRCLFGQEASSCPRTGPLAVLRPDAIKLIIVPEACS